MKVNIFWFRRDLRLDDNNGLYNALKSTYPVLPLFIFDKDILNKLENKSDARVEFIFEALKEIDSELSKKGSKLLILYGKPLDIFKKILDNYEIEKVYTNNDYEPYAIKRDIEVEEFLRTKSISFKSYKDQVIFERDEIVKKDKSPYTVFTPYSKIWKDELRKIKINVFDTKKHFQNLLPFNKFQKLYEQNIESINNIGFKETGIVFPSKEILKDLIENYDKTRNYPAIKGTSRLSVHLRFGTLSIRKLLEEALKLNDIWLNELIWREFFMMILYNFPDVVNNSFKPAYDRILWRNNENEFDAWCNGKTGYPIVDAGMRELNTTGFMHNRVRMITASFLCKHLLIDWRWGEAYFAEKLLDYELSSNNGNWQWAAGSGCDAAPYFRIFNPAIQREKFDPDFIYIRKWVPEYNSTDYMQHIVEHKFARERALNTYKEALQQF